MPSSICNARVRKSVAGMTVAKLTKATHKVAVRLPRPLNPTCLINAASSGYADSSGVPKVGVVVDGEFADAINLNLDFPLPDGLPIH
jgi:hypothetical protein